MFKPQHCGLYFTAESIQRARKHRKRNPFKQAWNMLYESEPTGRLAAIQWNGLRYRFDNDIEAGERAVPALSEALAAELTDEITYWDALTEHVVLAQCIEMLRDHPALTQPERDRCLEAFQDRADALNQPAHELTATERLWLVALNVAAGVVLEDEALFNTGIAAYQQAVDRDIHPEGYIPDVVEAEEPDHLLHQLLSVQALALTAEAASHAGVDLWQYNKRGVSTLTAAAYPLYYYFYPEKWKWDEGLDLETAGSIFRQSSGFLEIVNRRYERPLKAVTMILDEIRPVYDLYGGGLTTLTHGIPKRRGLFG